MQNTLFGEIVIHESITCANLLGLRFSLFKETFQCLFYLLGAYIYIYFVYLSIYSHHSMWMQMN